METPTQTREERVIPVSLLWRLSSLYPNTTTPLTLQSTDSFLLPHAVCCSPCFDTQLEGWVQTPAAPSSCNLYHFWPRRHIPFASLLMPQFFIFVTFTYSASHTWWLNNGRDHLGTGQRRAALFYFHPLKDFTMQCMRMSDIHTQKTETSPLLVFLHACSVVLLTTPACLPPPLSPRLLSSHGRLIRQTFMWKFFKHDSCYF